MVFINVRRNLTLMIFFTDLEKVLSFGIHFKTSERLKNLKVNEIPTTPLKHQMLKRELFLQQRSLR